jgi:ABC-type sulfate/molybdate transport systems ATPase subunit
MTGLAVRLRRRAGAFTLDVALELGAEALAIVGPNGAGKTTLLLSILGELPADDGQVVLAGQTLFDGAAAIDVPPEERRIAYLPQDYALFPHLTAVQNVAFALACRQEGRPVKGGLQRRAQALEWLERLGGQSYADRLPATLSGGERQRVALARALATDPRALLFDEPFAALDVEARDEVRAYLRARLAELKLPALIVTHDRADVDALGAAAVVLEGGRVVQRGTLAELRAHPATAYVARFAG